MKYLVVLIFLYSFYSLSISLNTNQNSTIELINADSLIGINLNDLSTREFIGNEIIKHNDVMVKADYAKQFLNENKVELIGNVIITQNTLKLFSQKITYYENTNLAFAYDTVHLIDNKTNLSAKSGTYNANTYIADFSDDVKVEDDSVLIYANRIIYDRKTRNSKAFGDVLMQDKFNNALLLADTIINYPNDNYSIAYFNPLLFKIDTLHQSDSLDKVIIKYDTTYISADTMESFRNYTDEYYKFTNNVEIIRNEVSAKSDLVIYTKDTISLYHNPIVWYSFTQLLSDTINILLENNNINRLEGINNSLIITQHDSTDFERFNQISGERIIIEFDSSSNISKIFAYINAKSIYFLSDEKGNNGLDRKNTDSILIEFNNNEIENIYWYGTTVGEFIPENFIFDNPADFNLPLFRWENNRPKKKLLNHLKIK